MALHDTLITNLSINSTVLIEKITSNY